MEKHFLLAVSGDRTASYNLRFVKSFFSEFCDIRLTLFYVAPRPPSWDFDAVLQPEQAALAELEEQRRTHEHEALEKAWEWITYRACDPGKVHKKAVRSTAGTVHEIIHEARAGMYDAVIMGRRGLSWFEELVEDSVSHQILWKDIDFPIWICRRAGDTERSNVLLCLDESAPARRVADHVGFILGEKERHRVTLFHVKPDNAHVTPKVRRILDDAREALAYNRFPEELTDVKIVQAKDVADAIVREAHDGNYAAVACGRTLDHPTAMGALIPSSVTTKLLRKLTDCALWISK